MLEIPIIETERLRLVPLAEREHPKTFGFENRNIDHGCIRR